MNTRTVGLGIGLGLLGAALFLAGLACGLRVRPVVLNVYRAPETVVVPDAGPACPPDIEHGPVADDAKVRT
jgi:hypothetical protein